MTFKTPELQQLTRIITIQILIVIIITVTAAVPTVPSTFNGPSDTVTASSFSSSFQHSDVTEEVYKERVDKLRKILVEGTYSTVQCISIV